MIICTIFASTAHLFLKFGAEKISDLTSIFNIYLFLGLIFFGIAAIFMMIAFRHGELSVLFPILATSYVWISLLSPVFFSYDSMNLLKWLGVLVILISVSLLGLNSSKNKVVISG